ncbi:hypothetical protein BD560DRAFT_409868 [Blakeslea trispora]|nr:hypothetical protein BD560DRAFT_409868 [Blakeslea trispora]
MLSSSRRLLSLVRTPRYARFSSSSSSCNNKLQLESTDTQASTTTDKEKKDNPTERIHFMPVINIPETELAHHAFFSLHRPLLGLSDTDERPFFSGKSTEEYNQEKLDMELNDYLLDRQPFDTPLPPGQKAESRREITIELEQDIALDDVFEEIRHDQIPVFHMPESNDILDFLSTVESKLKKENAIFELKESRQRKIELIKRFHAAKRRRNK